MTKYEEYLQKYTEKLIELDLFRDCNKDIVNKIEELSKELEALAEELKNIAKEENKDIENNVVKVSVIERWKKTYDYETFSIVAPEKEFQILKKAKGIKSEIEKPVFDELVKQGLISEETKQNIFKEELITKSVLIKHKL